MALSPSATTKDDSIYSNLPLLDPKSIRILTILPGNRGDVIECTLEVVDLDEGPDYEALSYCWGPISPAVTVTYNGQPTSVTPNLGAALQRLRYPENGIKSTPRDSLTPDRQRAPEKPRRLWIDALCINQQDLEERSKQVSFMKEVYDRATKVVIWLGEQEDFTPSAISLIQQVARVAQAEPGFDLGGHPRIPLEGDFLPRDDLPAPDDKTWDSVDLFYEIKWFRRIWVIQEATRDDSQMIMGSYKVSFFEVCLASEWISKRDSFLTLRRILALTPSFMIYGFGNGGSLLTMLAGSSPMEASEPRDKIYALLGLYHSWACVGGRTGPSFMPDYGKSIPEVYMDLVRFFLALDKDKPEEEGSLRIMLRNESFIMEEEGIATKPQDNEDDDKFPSWVPRWDLCRPVWLGLSRSRRDIEWLPSGESLVALRETTKSSILSLKGFVVCTVDFLKQDFELPTPRLTYYDADLRATLDEILEASSAIGGDDLMKEAFANTLTAGKSRNRETFEPYGTNDLEAYLNHGRTSIEGAQFAEAFILHMTFFMTSNGYMGLGSSKMQVGDKVVVFFGGEVLFILRPNGPEGSTYKLVGEAYVHGLMQGEGMAMLVSGESQEQWFDLQ